MAGGCYICQRNLEPCFKCGMQSRSIGTLWESVRNATPKIHVSGQQDCQVIFMRIKFWRALILSKRSHLNTMKQEKRSNELAYIHVYACVSVCVYILFPFPSSGDSGHTFSSDFPRSSWSKTEFYPTGMQPHKVGKWFHWTKKSLNSDHLPHKCKRSPQSRKDRGWLPIAATAWTLVGLPHGTHSPSLLLRFSIPHTHTSTDW